MYGLIARITVISGKSDEVIALLADSSRNLPGCFSYVIARDASDPDVLWITEIWESQASHDASLNLRAVQAALPHIKPLIVHFEKVAVTEPIAGLPVSS